MTYVTLSQTAIDVLLFALSPDVYRPQHTINTSLLIMAIVKVLQKGHPSSMLLTNTYLHIMKESTLSNGIAIQGYSIHTEKLLLSAHI